MRSIDGGGVHLVTHTNLTMGVSCVLDGWWVVGGGWIVVGS